MPLPPVPSPAGAINLTDLRSLLLTATAVAAAAGLTYGVDHLAELQLSDSWQLVVVTILSTVIKLLQKYLRGPVVGLLLVGAMLLLPSVAMAETLVVDAGTKPGVYFLRVNVAADGTATITTITKVVQLSDPSPAPNPTPAPDVMTDRAKLVQAAAVKVQGDPDRDTSAKALAALYREVSKRGKVGEVATADDLLKLLRMSTDMLLSSRGPTAAGSWQPVRDVVSSQWAAVAAKGGSVSDYAALLDEVAAGLDASAPNKAIDPEMLKLILEIIKIVMALLIK